MNKIKNALAVASSQGIGKNKLHEDSTTLTDSDEFDWTEDEPLFYAENQPIVWGGITLGELYYFSPPGSHISKSSHSVLCDLELRAWPNETHALMSIHAWARTAGLVSDQVHSKFLDP